jgi:peptidoglycan/xylan/chitin deacetylase (PgdA/CDA1 family)
VSETVEWPNGKKFAVCLTHDVDRVKKTYQYFTHFLKTRDFYHLKSFFSREEEPYWNFERIVEIEKKHGVRSTFFFLNETKQLDLLHPKKWALSLDGYCFHDEKIAEIIQKLHANGWEIGLHGSYESYKDKDLLKKEKKELEDILGEDIAGIRQHYLNLKIPETWEIQYEVGFKYDSTFGYRDRIGFKDGKYLPFHPLSNSFFVIPLTIMDSALFSNYKNEDEIWRICIDLINTVEKHKGLLTVLWHQRFFNENEFPGMISIYEKIIKISKEKNAWITTAYNIIEWLTMREIIMGVVI